jgi:hypothetical protein
MRKRVHSPIDFRCYGLPRSTHTLATVVNGEGGASGCAVGGGREWLNKCGVAPFCLIRAHASRGFIAGSGMDTGSSVRKEKIHLRWAREPCAQVSANSISSSEVLDTRCWRNRNSKVAYGARALPMSS